MRAPNWVGDVVMATPALRALRASHPTARITVEARPFLRGLLEGLPYVDEFLPDGGKLRERVRALRERRFDWALLLPNSPRSALAPFLARIPVRIGYSRDPARRLLVNRALRPEMEGKRPRPISMIERYLVVTRALGCSDDGDAMDVPIPDAARDGLRARLIESGIDRDAGVLLAVPGANFGSSKLWPAEHFATACDAIALRHGWTTVIAPGPGEEELARSIVSGMSTRAVSLEGTKLVDLSALTELARLVVTNDTGPRHIAVALGIPTVVTIGPTDARHTAHHLERQRVVREEVDCAPCGLKRCPIDHRCMTRLGPERVALAAEELLA
ncbi:MAG: lipopolysaccharide heptosyltransferase II [bacterium]|nr:lipopolysaccharide heptosyltransferase II [bacterium]